MPCRVVITGMSFGVVGGGGVGNACHPSSQKHRGFEVRSACQSWISAPSVAPSTTSNLRQPRMRATSTSKGGSDLSGRRRRKAGRGHFTDQLTLPIVAPGLPFPHLLKGILAFVLIAVSAT